MPERHFPGLARRRRNHHAVVCDILDPPGGSAQNNGVARAALENHLLIQLAHPRAPGRLRQENSVQTAIRNRPAVDDRHSPRALPAGQLIAQRDPR